MSAKATGPSGPVAAQTIHRPTVSDSRDEQPCPCGRSDPKGKPFRFADCCLAFLSGSIPAPDAERLMRSRYSAFATGQRDYLLNSWHASTRPAALDLEPDARWLGLEVRQHRSTGPDTAEVEFVARFRVGGKAVRQHERSRFLRQDGHWFYLDGDVL